MIKIKKKDHHLQIRKIKDITMS